MHINDNGEIDNMMDYVHMNKNCFYAHQISDKIHITAKEYGPEDIHVHAKEDGPKDLHAQHKSYICRVLFLASIDRLQPVSCYEWQDGKLGWWAFTESVVS